MKNLLILCLAAFFGIQISFAQTTITGKVTSNKDGTPISGALIKAKGVANMSVNTDINGNYSFNIPANVKDIEITANGFSMKTQSVGENKLINFVLTPAINKNRKTIKKTKSARLSTTKINSVKN